MGKQINQLTNEKTTMLTDNDWLVVDESQQDSPETFITKKIRPSKAKGYREYWVLLDQASISAPNEVELMNSLGGIISYSYVSPGVYELSSNGENLFAGLLSYSYSDADYGVLSDIITQLELIRIDNDTIRIASKWWDKAAGESEYADDILNKTTFHLFVFDLGKLTGFSNWRKNAFYRTGTQSRNQRIVGRLRLRSAHAYSSTSYSGHPAGA